MSNKAKTPDDWARTFKLHNCIGNKRFADQVKQIQADVRRVVEKEQQDKQKS